MLMWIYELVMGVQLVFRMCIGNYVMNRCILRFVLMQISDFFSCGEIKVSSIQGKMSSLANQRGPCPHHTTRSLQR